MISGIKSDEIKDYRNAIRLTESILSRLSQGESKKEIAVSLDITPSKLSRMLDGIRESETGNKRALLGESGCGGRPPAVEIDADTAGLIKVIAERCGSAKMAYCLFKADPRCPEGLRDYIQAKIDSGRDWTLPVSLRRAAYVTPEHRAHRKGPVAYQHAAFKTRHKDRVIDPVTGQERDLLAGDIYLSDDMSVNHPFWYELDEREAARRARAGDRLAERLGVGVGRQGLYSIDARGFWLGVNLIGRARDVYTSADLLRHFRMILNTYGCPRCAWYLEKGVWASKNVDGQLVKTVGPEAREALIGGLGELDFETVHMHTSEGKALIEGAFGHLQRIMDGMFDWPTIGRKRGEMEREAKMMRRVQHGTVHPADVGLPHMDELLIGVQSAMDFFNTQHKNGRIQRGIPAERWLRDTEAHGLLPVPAAKKLVFLPMKHETFIRNGAVEKKIAGRIYRFTAPELFARVGGRYRLLMAFDPTDPAEGAELYNLEARSRNVDGYGAGEWMGHAEWMPDMPVFGMDASVHDNIALKKRYTRAFRDASATMLPQGGVQLRTESRDGICNVMRREFPGGGSLPKTRTTCPTKSAARTYREEETEEECAVPARKLPRIMTADELLNR
jgi:hypothetical protein